MPIGELAKRANVSKNAIRRTNYTLEPKIHLG